MIAVIGKVRHPAKPETAIFSCYFFHCLRFESGSAFHQEDAQLEDCHFDILPTVFGHRLREPFTGFENQSSRLLSSPPSKCAAMLGIAMGRCRLVASLGGSFGAAWLAGIRTPNFYASEPTRNMSPIAAVNHWPFC